MKLCLGCERPMPSSMYMASRKYCSQPCRKQKGAEIARGPRRKWNRSTGTVGAISELVVSADLLKLGYDVFRAVSQSCPCDLIAMAHGRAIRVEVRTGSYRTNGELWWSSTAGERHRYDVMAVAAPSGLVEYFPPLCPEGEDIGAETESASADLTSGSNEARP
jgi:PD-(D/E)XK endonuclease